LFVVEYSCGEPLFDVFPVLFDWIEFWAVRRQADHFDVIFPNVREHFFSEMPSCIIDDDAQFFVVLMESFEKCKIFFSVYFWAQLCYNLANAQCSERMNFL
jgi:hypothetical protein